MGIEIRVSLGVRRRKNTSLIGAAYYYAPSGLIVCVTCTQGGALLCPGLDYWSPPGCRL